MSKLGKRIWILLLLLFGLILLSSIALYYASPMLAEKALNHWLKQQNYSSIELRMKPPGWNTLELEKISLIKETEDKITKIQSANIQVSYDPWQLYFNQRLDSILLPKSHIEIRFKDTSTNEQATDLIDLSGILPSEWLGNLPVAALRIGQLDIHLDYPKDQNDWAFNGSLLIENSALYSRIRFSRNETELGWGDLQLTRDDTVKLRLLDKDKAFFHLEGELGFSDRLNLTSKQIVTLDNFSKIAGKFDLFNTPELSGQVIAEGKSTFPIKTRLSPDALLQSIQTQQQVSAQVTLQKPIERIGGVELDLTASLNFSLEELNFKLSDSSSLQFKNITLEDNHPPLKAVTVNLSQPINLDLKLTPLYSGEQFAPSISPIALEIATKAITLPSLSLSESRFTVKLNEIDLLKRTLQGQIESKNLAVTLANQAIPLFNLFSPFSMEQDKFKIQPTLTTPSLPLSITVNAATHLATKKTELHWKLKPVPLNKIDIKIADYIKVPAELSMHSGTLFHNGHAVINNNGSYSATLRNSLRNVNLSWDEITVEGLEHNSRTRLSSNGNISDTGDIKLNKVITGLEITKVRTGYAYQRKKGRDHIKLDMPQAELLQGLITFADFGFDPLAPDFSTQVTVDRLDLGEILALERQQGLSGEGKLSGNFPLRYGQNQLTISDGKLNGDAPGGRILFTPSATVQAYAASNVGLKMAIEALGNFHYQTLEIGLNYLHDGTALLATRLKGKNPQWNNGHPVDFTINVEENIPKLIKTLQFADKLTKTIEKRYR